MNHETFAFLYHRGMTLFVVAFGYWYARVSRREIRWPLAVLTSLMGLLIAAVSRLVVGPGALPFYDPLFFFAVWGITSVITSHTMRLGTRPTPPDKADVRDRSEATV